MFIQPYVKPENNLTPIIKTNYYPIQCVESRRKIVAKYNFQGRANEPNITYATNGKIPFGYQAIELSLCPIKESMTEFPFLKQAPQYGQADGAIVISHRPLTNGPILYSCFFLVHSSQSQNESIEHLFHFRDSMKKAYQPEPVYLTMNDFIQNTPQVYQSHFLNEPCIVLFYPDTIPVHFPEMKLVGGKPKATLLPTIPTTNSTSFIGLDWLWGKQMEGFGQIMNYGNLTKYGGTSTKCTTGNSSSGPPDLSNLPKASNIYTGPNITPNANYTASSVCTSIGEGIEYKLAKGHARTVWQEIINDTYGMRKQYDGIDVNYYSSDQATNCLDEYIIQKFGSEANFQNYLIQIGVTIPDYYNYWNPRMFTNGFDSASISYNLDGQCYDPSTVQFNIGRVQAAGYGSIADTYSSAKSFGSQAAASVAGGLSKYGSTALEVITGTGTGTGTNTQGPMLNIKIPANDDPDATYQECTMVPIDGIEDTYVYTTQQQSFQKYNSLVAIVFYFILFLIIYMGTPFAYFFVMCTILKHGYNTSGSATFAEYLRKPQNLFGLGKARGLSIVFNIVYWFIALVVFFSSLIPGANVTQINTVLILMVIAWIIGFIGVKNNPPPDSCFY